MKPWSAVTNNPEFGVGVREMAHASLGILAWGLTTGMVLSNIGLSTFEAVFMTLVVFAGSAQLAAAPLILVGAPLWVIWATALCVNLRFIVFSAHMQPYLAHLSRGRRLLYSYILGDLSYVLFTKRYHHPGQDERERDAHEAYWLGSIVTNWVAWMVGSMSGIALASWIPSSWGLGFAGILALLGVTFSLASSKLRIIAALIAGAVAVLAFALPLKLNILTAIAVAVAAALTLEQGRGFVRMRP
jgi:predicted branched-subunit amino acid permease